MARISEQDLLAGREALRALGVSEEESAPAVLLPLAGRSQETDLAIVERLALEPAADRAAALSDLAIAAEHCGWKLAAKQARRALYRFAQRGIPIPELQRETPAAPRTPASSLEGYLSAIDGRGDRLLWLVRPRPEGGLTVLTGVLNEPTGLREIASAELGRKKLRAMERDLHAKHRLRMVPADGRYCDALLCQGFARARAAGATGVGEFPTYRAQLVGTDPAPLEPPLIDRVLAPDDPAIAGAATRGADLLAEPEFATWLLERPLLASHLSEIAQAQESPLVLSRPQQEERVRSAAARALRELFADTGAAIYRRRLEEMAYYLHTTGRRELAAAAAATARALAATTRGGEGIAFCEELLRRSLTAHLAEDKARAEAESEGSVLVRPRTGPPSAQRQIR